MNIFCVSILPDIYDSFKNLSLVKRAQENGLLTFEVINPRDFCLDKHRQVDDDIYGWWPGLLIKAKPVVDAVEHIFATKISPKSKKSDTAIIYCAPSHLEFTQHTAHELVGKKNLIFIAGRYEWIDHRFELYLQKKYKKNFMRISLGKFVTMGWETPSMVMIEAITRLIPWVLHDEMSVDDESYSPSDNLQTLEYPQYTRPEELRGMEVPEVLLSGNHKKIADRRNKNKKSQ